jgi:parallel beta-helix repeat protein
MRPTPTPGTWGVPPGPVINSANFASIQAAIDSLESTGGSVRIPTGTHLLPAKVRVYSNVHVFGDGMDVTILRFAQGVTPDNMMSNANLTAGNTNLIIRDLTLAGPGGAPSAGGCCFGLRLVNVTSSFVVRVAADNHSKDGFYLGYNPNQFGVNGTRLSGCRATQNGRNGISITHGSHNIVDNCLVRQNNRNEAVAGIDLEPDDGLAVTNNKLVNNQARDQNVGIQLFRLETNSVANNAICNNTATGNGTGLYDRKGQGNYWVNNTSTNNGLDTSIASTSFVGGQYTNQCSIPALPDFATVLATPTSGSASGPAPPARSISPSGPVAPAPQRGSDRPVGPPAPRR